jgi:ectoine hydroxylase-related dioxygenase (phytanoyl-CoA dioxygenase family)
MLMSRLSTEALNQIAERGYMVVLSCLDGSTVSEFGDLLDAGHAGVRDLLDVPAIRRLAGSSAVRSLMEPVLGSNCFAVRGILFNKGDDANWKVPWHQDCVIAVAEQQKIPSWGPWSIKAGVHHVRPNSDLMSSMMAIRIHLDEYGADNGPLRVLPGSHKQGFVSDREIQEYPKDGAVTCIASRGEALLMRPLLLHGSSAAKSPNTRRVVHLEFAADELLLRPQVARSRVTGTTGHQRLERFRFPLESKRYRQAQAVGIIIPVKWVFLD